MQVCVYIVELEVIRCYVTTPPPTPPHTFTHTETSTLMKRFPAVRKTDQLKTTETSYEPVHWDLPVISHGLAPTFPDAIVPLLPDKEVFLFASSSRSEVTSFFSCFHFNMINFSSVLKKHFLTSCTGM